MLKPNFYSLSICPAVPAISGVHSTACSSVSVPHLMARADRDEDRLICRPSVFVLSTRTATRQTSPNTRKPARHDRQVCKDVAPKISAYDMKTCFDGRRSRPKPGQAAMRRPRGNHTAAFAAKVAVAALKGRQDAGRTGGEVRCSRESDHAMEDATAGRCDRGCS